MQHMKRDMLGGAALGLLGSVLTIGGGIALMTMQAERALLGCEGDGPDEAEPARLDVLGLLASK